MPERCTERSIAISSAGICPVLGPAAILVASGLLKRCAHFSFATNDLLSVMGDQKWSTTSLFTTSADSDTV